MHEAMLDRGPGTGLTAAMALIAWLFWLPIQAQQDAGVRIGIYQNAPKLHVDDSGEPAGFFIDLIELIARDQGWRPEYVECNWAECLELLRYGDIDLMPDVALTESRRQQFAFHQIPVVQSWSQVYCLAQKDFTSLADLAGATVAVLEGSVQHDFLLEVQLQQNVPLVLRTVDTLPAAFELARTGAADVAVANHFFGQRNAFDYDLVETPITFNQASLFFAASPDARRLLPPIDQALRGWKKNANSPYYDALNRSYATPIRSRWPDWLMPALVTGIALVIMLGAGLLLLRWRVHSATARLEQTNQRLNHLLESAPVVLYALKFPEMTVEWVSPTVERVTGFPLREASRSEWWPEHVHPDDKARIEAENLTIKPNRTLVQEYRVLGRDGETLYVRDEKRFIPDDDDGTSGTIIGSWNNVTAARRQARQVDFLSHHDRLTSLPNRGRLEWLLEKTLATAERNRTGCQVILLDLDRFKSINETLGVAAGDRILRLVTSRLLTWGHDDDVVARFGNDEFCMVTLGLSQAEMHDRLDRLVAEIATPTPVAGRDLLLTASVGVAIYPRDGTRPETLLQRASQALQSSRVQGGNRWQAFDPELEGRTETSPFLESDLRHAIQNQDLTLYFQPQFKLSDNSTVGVEVLVRWHHPEHGMLLPASFIPMAEQTGLIEAMDLWVIRETCRQLAAWRNSDQPVARASVNLSARELYNENLPVYVGECLAEFDLPPMSLTLELTETMLMESPERAREVLEQIKSLGVRIAMDDFGTGYSNLAYLAQLPIDEVKLDQSLVRELDNSSEMKTLLQGMISLFDRLGLALVAEGIETDDQLRFLIEAGCPTGQGYLLARPAPAATLFECIPPIGC